MAGEGDPAWSSQSGDGAKPARTSQYAEARLPTPTSAAVKVRVFGFIDWSLAGSGGGSRAWDRPAPGSAYVAFGSAMRRNSCPPWPTTKLTSRRSRKARSLAAPISRPHKKSILTSDSTGNPRHALAKSLREDLVLLAGVGRVAP
jgi:hypothetical protein